MTPDPTRPPAIVLLVEDSDNDAELARLGLANAGVDVQLLHVRNGEECLDYLRNPDNRAPDLVLLDLNMPRMNGREVLEEIGRDETLRHLPVVVMTTSHAPNDVLSLYQLRCSSYIVKPIEFRKFIDVIRLLAEYWFSIVTLPPLPTKRNLSRPTHGEP